MDNKAIEKMAKGLPKNPYPPAEEELPLLSEVKRNDYFENELEWLYERLASDVEALVPENLRYNVRWIIKENFGKGIIKAERHLIANYLKGDNR